MAVPTLVHEAREHLNAIGLLARCLQIRDATAADLREWRSEIVVAAKRLQFLYARGVNRRALLATIRAEALNLPRTNTNATSGMSRFDGEWERHATARSAASANTR